MSKKNEVNFEFKGIIKQTFSIALENRHIKLKPRVQITIVCS